MRGHLLALVCVLAVASELSASVSRSSSLAWRRYKSEHAKVYGPEEDATRLANFLATKQLVERHNANPNATYKMRLNHMADWTREEWHQLTGFKRSRTPKLEANGSLNPKLARLLDGPVPKEVDWRKANRVTAVKNQGHCGSCWAFAATGVLEGQQALLNMSTLIPLSEQELLDCSKKNFGCFGGDPGVAVDELAFHIEGIESEADYPYEAKKDTCRLDKSKFVMSPTASDLVQDEGILLKAVAYYGPVAVSILATENFRNYGSGVLDDADCGADCVVLMNHAVLVVGYGTDAKGGDYWLVKNSWGAKWGDEGYIKMKRGVDMCCIGDSATVAYF